MVKQNQIKSSPAKQKKQTNKAKPHSRVPGVQLMGQNTRLNFVQTPYTTSSTQNEPTWLRMQGKVSHPELGGGVRVAGRQLLCIVATSAGDYQLFSGSGATLNSANSIHLSPDTLNGRLALQARAYDRYIFRKVKLTYVSRVPTTQAGSFALGYVSDPVFPTPYFYTVASMSPAMQTSFYGTPSSIVLVDDMNSTKSFFTLYDGTNNATLRQTVQGSILGAPDASSLGAIFQGSIWIDYLIDLYQPTIDQNFTLRLTEEEQKMIVANRLESKPTIKVITKDEEAPSRESQLNEIGALQLRLQQLKSGNLNL